jgi:hypothetical protein
MNIQKKTDLTENELFLDKDKNRMYLRVVGGIAFPSHKPGHLVIIAEDLHPDPAFKKRHLHLLAEHEHFDLTTLLRKATEYIGSIGFKNFYGELATDNQRFLTMFNADCRKKHHPGIHITSAPYTDNQSIGFHVNLLHSLLQQNQKLLHLGDKSKTPSYLQEIQNENVTNAKNSEYPAVAALGYAAAALTIWHSPKHRTNKLKKQRHNPHLRFSWK